MDLDRYLSTRYSDLNDDDKIKFSRSIVELEVRTVGEFEQLEKLFTFAQELLKFRSEQVDGLELELDELATKQGEEEARHKEEVEELRDELSAIRRTGGSAKDGSAEEDLRVELEHAERRTERLLAELQSREEEQLSDRRELERLAAQVASLENERSQLRREVAALQDDMRDNQKSHLESHSPPDEIREKQQQLVETVRQKNKHISQLLSDVEAVENENSVLREKMLTVKAELVEAAENLKRTTGEITGLQVTKDEQQEQIQQLELLCEALRNQVQDLVSQKTERDNEIDKLGRIIDERVQEWKRVVEEKEKELQSMREKAYESHEHGILHDTSARHVALLSETLQKRENQIEDLQKQLYQATADLNESTSLIESLRSQSVRLPQEEDQADIAILRRQLHQAEERAQMLDEKLQDAEQDALNRSEDITEMVVQLRRYEAGEYGLSEAVAEIKELTQQRQVRDKHIEQLIDTTNQLHAACNNLEEQNLALRDQLGLPPDEDVDTSGVKAKREKDQLMMQVQQQHLDRLEEELVEVKMEKRNLIQEVLSLRKQLKEDQGFAKSSKSELDTTTDKNSAVAKLHLEELVQTVAARKVRKLQREQHKLESERKIIVEENESLRQGLHEILESIHLQDGSSNVQLESKVLEQLLQALDSRHVSGWYHPAMRLQAQVNTVEGSNAALRDQLRKARQNEAKSLEQLELARITIADMERSSATISNQELKIGHNQEAKESLLNVTDEISISLSLPPDLPASSVDIINKLNNHLLVVLNEYEIEKEHAIKLEEAKDELRREVDLLLEHLAQTYRSHSQAQVEYDSAKQAFEEEKEKLETDLASSQARAAVLNDVWTAHVSENNAEKCSAYDSAQKIATLAQEKAVTDRHLIVARRQAQNARNNEVQLKKEWDSVRIKLTCRLGDLLNSRRSLSSRITDLEKILLEYVPLSQLQAANRRVEDVTSKYTVLVRQHEIMIQNLDNKFKQMQAELVLEREEKTSLSVSLQETNRKLISAESGGKSLGTDLEEKKLSSQLANVETDLISERLRATHAEKMCAFAKGELEEVQKRCAQLEQEVLNLISSNHELLRREEALEARCLESISGDKMQNLSCELAAAKAKVVELQANREHLQELADIAQEQVSSLNMLHEGNEYHLDSLRKSLYQLQATSDQAATIAMLNEDLRASRLRETSTINQMSALQAELLRVQGVNERIEKSMDELRKDMSLQQEENARRTKMLSEIVSDLRFRCVGNLSSAFLHQIVMALTQRSSECKNLWEQLQKARKEIFLLSSASHEDVVLRQQTLELQSILQTSHSDLICQRNIESILAKNTELRLKEMKSSRQCEALDSQLRQAEQRIKDQEELLGTLEMQLMSIDGHDESLAICLNKCESHEKKMKLKHDKGTQIENLPQEKSVMSPFKRLEKNQSLADVPQQEPLSPISQIQENFTSPKMGRPSATSSPLLSPLHLASVRDGLSSPGSDSEKIPMTDKEERQHQSEIILLKKPWMPDLSETVATLRNQVTVLEQQLSSKENELKELREAHLSREKIFQDKNEISSDCTSVESQNKRALKATVDSLQNIINQKEETIKRYQSLMRDMREEDSHVIAGLHHQVRNLQAGLLIQEQAYNRLKTSLRQQAVETGSICSPGSARSTLDSQLTRNHELEDEVTLLSNKVASLTVEVQAARQEAVRWSTVAQQKLHTLDDVELREEEQQMTSVQPQLSPQRRATSGSSSTHNENKRSVGLEHEGIFRNRTHHMQVQLREEVCTLRFKLQQMEEQELQSRREIQRLRDQIPIYSRRSRRAQSEAGISEQEEELRKTVQELQDQISAMKQAAEKAEMEWGEKEAKKLKSTENIARWDERKRYQNQMERLKNRVQEKNEMMAMLQNKTERMKTTIHRLEREKIILEHQLKTTKESSVPRNVLEEVEKENSNLRAELNEIKNNESNADKWNREHAQIQKANLALECENLELKLELEKIRADTPRLQHKLQHLEKIVEELHLEQSTTSEKQRRTDVQSGTLRRLDSDQTNVELHKTVAVLQRIVERLQGENKALLSSSCRDKMAKEISHLKNENRELQDKCQDLAWQLERANIHIASLEASLNVGGSSDSALLRSELHQKCQLLSKVKILLERAALKERDLREQVARLQGFATATT